jgi:hypothetical protein
MNLHTRTQLIGMEIKLPFGWKLYIENDERDALTGRTYIRVGDPNGVDNTDTSKAMPWKGRWWPLANGMTDGEIVQTIFLATMTALEHETRETFFYKGVSVFDPHYDIEKLVELRKQPDALKERAA